MTGHQMPAGADLTPKQKKAIAALLTARTQAEAAKAAQVGERSIKRWLSEDKRFKAAYQAALRDLIANASAKLSKGADAAIDSLLDVARSGESESARVQAARAVLDQNLRYSEFADVLQSLTALEEASRDV
ncbi:MAG: hypothetical protein E7000_04315 [Coriobacteriaceae bacterium]|nr:hypothetical protein [Coriobacteriaceae bacterium]